MTPAFRRFLAEDGGRLASAPGRFLALGAFGKHPGWDDHIEDLGLETETLALARKVFYVEGVGGQIDKGAWEKLPPGMRLDNFNHSFVWHRSGQFLVGRMWSSSDGKGRTRYPMVICAHFSGATLSWGVEQLLPRLAELEQACRSAKTAEEVRGLLARDRAALRAALAQARPDTRSPALAPDSLQLFVRDAVFGPDQQGWNRILYDLQNRMAPFATGHFEAKDTAAWAQHTRLPVAPAFAGNALLLWNEFLANRIDRRVPMLLILPSGQPWLDVICGEPSSSEFFCLRAQPDALPLATDIPYDLDAAFKIQARRIMSDFQRAAGIDDENLPADGESAPGGWTSFTQRWFKGK
jgi:hypothetical protein